MVGDMKRWGGGGRDGGYQPRTAAIAGPTLAGISMLSAPEGCPLQPVSAWLSVWFMVCARTPAFTSVAVI